jgi:hypothetical protein
MFILLHRIAKRANYTIGRLSIEDEYYCDTLEPTEREGGVKIMGRTAIPKGVYRILITYSPRMKKKAPLLLNVPNFEGVRIHAGNTYNDTEGCILCGFNTIVGKLTQSKKTTDALVAKIADALKKGEQVYIKVE